MNAYLRVLAGAVAPCLAFAVPAAAEQQPASTTAAARTFGSAASVPGTITRGKLTVPQGKDAGYDLPVIVITGAHPGPSIALVSGLHGTEFAGMVALQQLAGVIDPATLSGTVVIVPLVNVASFEHLTRHLNPVDGKNMNRVFPGRADGTQSERAADLITREILARVDDVIDYHGGDLDEDQIPYSYLIKSGNDTIDAANAAMIRAFAPRFAIEFDASHLTRATANLLPTQAIVLGKPTITVDAGRSGTYTAADIALLVDGTVNVLRHLKMIEGRAPSAAPPTYFQRTTYVNSPATGVFHTRARRGDSITRGQVIGTVSDVDGQNAVPVSAPESGIVLYQNSTPSAVSGEQLFYLGLDATQRSTVGPR